MLRVTGDLRNIRKTEQVLYILMCLKKFCLSHRILLHILNGGTAGLKTALLLTKINLVWTAYKSFSLSEAMRGLWKTQATQTTALSHNCLLSDGTGALGHAQTDSKQAIRQLANHTLFKLFGYYRFSDNCNTILSDKLLHNWWKYYFSSHYKISRGQGIVSHMKYSQ